MEAKEKNQLIIKLKRPRTKFLPIPQFHYHPDRDALASPSLGDFLGETEEDSREVRETLDSPSYTVEEK